MRKLFFVVLLIASLGLLPTVTIQVDREVAPSGGVDKAFDFLVPTAFASGKLKACLIRCSKKRKQGRRFCVEESTNEENYLFPGLQKCYEWKEDLYDDCRSECYERHG